MKKMLGVILLAAALMLFAPSCGKSRTAAIYFAVTSSCAQANVNYNSPAGPVSGIQNMPFTSPVFVFDSVINPTITASTSAPAACNIADTVTCEIYKDGILWKTAGPSQSATASGGI
jgi:hypothetical protein